MMGDFESQEAFDFPCPQHIQHMTFETTLHEFIVPLAVPSARWSHYWKEISRLRCPRTPNPPSYETLSDASILNDIGIDSTHCVVVVAWKVPLQKTWRRGKSSNASRLSAPNRSNIRSVPFKFSGRTEDVMHVKKIGFTSATYLALDMKPCSIWTRRSRNPMGITDRWLLGT